MKVLILFIFMDSMDEQPWTLDGQTAMDKWTEQVSVYLSMAVCPSNVHGCSSMLSIVH